MPMDRGYRVSMRTGWMPKPPRGSAHRIRDRVSLRAILHKGRCVRVRNPGGDPGTYTTLTGTTPHTVVITLTSANIALLDSYLSADSGTTPGSANDVGLGFGPDCHFYDSGVTLAITTGSSAVPVER